MSKDNNIEHFDNLFKEKLGEASVKAPSGVWENVSTQIGSGVSGVGAASTVVGKSVLIKIVTVVVVATITAVAVMNLSSPDAVDTDKKENGVFKDNSSTTITTNQNKAVASEEGTVSISNTNKEKELAISKEVLASANPINPSSANNGSLISKGEENNKDLSLKEKEPSIPEDAIVTNHSDEIGTINPLNIDLKEKYCIGEVLELSANGNAYAIWYLNGVRIGKGNKVSYAFKNTGKKKLVVKENKALLFESTLHVIGPNTNFGSLAIGEGEYALTPVEDDATFVWNVGDEKGYQATNDGDLIVKDYVRVRIPVTLIVKTKEGCIDSVKQSIINDFVVKGENPKMADAFIPGNDGYNDKFVVEIKHETYFNFVVKNRKGEVVFKSLDKNIQWDGKCNYADCPSGLYTYTLLYKIEGSDELQFKNGTIALIEE